MANGLLRGIGAMAVSQVGTRKLVGFPARPNKADLTVSARLMEERKVTPLIDRRYRLSEVPEAIRYLEEGHAQGKVVISLD